MQVALEAKIVQQQDNAELLRNLEQLELTSNLVAVTGVSFGDEGKGRIVHELASRVKEETGKPVAAVFKVNGGANSGHTAAGLKLNLLPTGVADRDIPNLVLGRGVVADPHKVLWEALPLDEKGYRVSERLVIDGRTMVSDFTHRLLDLGKETFRERQTGESRGSTGRGISPAFSAETDQSQIYYDVFLGDKARFVVQMEDNIERCERRLQSEYQLTEEEWDGLFEQLSQAEQRANGAAAHLFPDNEFDFSRFKGDAPFSLNREALVEAYWNAGQTLRESVGSAGELLNEQLNSGEFVVCEFGQAYLLGKRTGFAPNVTASHPYTPEIFPSAAIPDRPVHTVTAAKAYDTKVGTHVFLTEIEHNHPLGQILRKLEFGTTTGRQRMVGWYDAVEKGHTLREGGFAEIVINKLDPLTHSGKWQGELQICTGYRLPDGSVTAKLPLQDEIRREAEPVYEGFRGWSEDITEIRSFDALPQEAKEYVAGLYYHTVNAGFADRETVGASELPGVRFVGVGPDPGQVIRDMPNGERLIEIYLNGSQEK
jgi:adenylosuccinate synthase